MIYMNTATVETIAKQPLQAAKSSVYQNKRVIYTVESIFTNKVELTEALYRIALTKIKPA